ncbi:MAG: TetR/AcrR family transcriptional regulator [Polyangiales bacterium]
MPKIVDHEAYRAELAAGAIQVFRRHGFHGLGMRKIAEELGVSKGTLYHYFPSKKALFEACSAVVTEFDFDALPAGASASVRFEALVAVALQLDADFRGELSLLVDYVRPLSQKDVRVNPLLRRALGAFEDAVAKIVGEEQASAALRQLLGILVMRIFDGGQSDFETLRPFCEDKAQ